MMQRYELAEYMDAGCMQVERGPGFAVGVGLYGFTGGRMCDGCPKFQGGKCPSYKELVSGRKQAARQIATAETVRQEAERLGISISEVRRRRRDALTTPNANAQVRAKAQP